jgi:hypothetical protein
MKTSSRYAISLCGALLLAAAPSLAASSSASSFAVDLDARKMHESCIRLEKGETARYEWKSDAPLDFNIHYHEGKEVFYPVKRDGATHGKDTFKAKIAQDYCWMWTASKRAKLEGRVEK